MDRIDLRSDTVTWPTPAMRQAMAEARLGDDVYGEDPTVNALEAAAAARVGHEAALFVASGTMGNLVAALSHATRGDEAIIGEDGHAFCWEAGSMSVVGGLAVRPLPTDDRGRMDLDQVRRAIRDDDPHLPRTRLIMVENSYGAKSGAAIPPDYFAGIRAIADEHGLRVHLDGARLFNAATALGQPVTAITRYADSVSFCLSKGLCAPAGSLLCGSNAFIHQARRVRKQLGGGMRQVGVLAAAGLIALNEMTLRLTEDHHNACRLAEGLARIPGIEIDPTAIQTNIVFFRLAETVPLAPQTIVDRLRQEANVWLEAGRGQRFRVVTHYWIGPAQVDIFLDALHTIILSAS